MSIKKITTTNGNEYVFVNESKGNRSGFYHLSQLYKNDLHINSRKVQYYNRTWESYQFRTSMSGCISELIADRTEKLLNQFKAEKSYAKLTQKRREEFENSDLVTKDTLLTEYKEVLASL